MWVPRRLTTLQVSTACYRYSFICTSYKASPYGVFSSLLLFSPFYIQIYSTLPLLKSPSISVFLSVSEAKFHAHTYNTQNYSFVYFNFFILRCQEYLEEHKKL
jgi:hypothetical protein